MGPPGQRKFPHDLLLALRENRVHLFVGSGASASAGLKGWDELIGDMKYAIRIENNGYAKHDLEDFFNRADHLDVAELFRQTVGSHAYFRFLRERYRREVRTSALLKAIAQMSSNTLYTTNYDQLLEKALRKTRRVESAVILYPDQLNYIQDDEVRLIKLHGDIDHPSTIILTRTDYAGYGGRHQDFVNQLQASVNASTVLFVGFGLRDPNFRRIYDDARSLTQSTNKQAYAVMPATNAVERKFWHDEGLTIVPLRSPKGVPSCLKNMCVASTDEVKGGD